MQAKKGKTTWKQFGKIASKDSKFLSDLLKDPANPNKVLEKHGKASLSPEDVRKWKVTWNSVIRNLIAPGLMVDIKWGGVWPSHWSPDLIRRWRD